MKKVIYLPLFVSVLFLAGCTLPAMIKMAKDQGLTVTPSPLEVHNDVVEYKMTTMLPVKMLKKNTVYTLNSYYKYGDNEITLDPVSFKASDYPNSGTKQPSITKSFSFPYKPAYEQGFVEIEGAASKGLNVKTSPRMKVVTGIITTSKMVEDVYYAAYAEHNYNNQEEFIPMVIPDFIFNQGKSRLRKSEIMDSDKGKQLDAFIASKNTTKSVSIIGTHSPEGSETANEKLAQERAAAIEKYYRDEMKKYDYKNMADSIQFILEPVVEKWDYFKKALAATESISSDEKSEYLNIINNGKSFVEQEREIQQLSTYKTVFKEVYPVLRTAKTRIFTVKDKKTDAEISTLAQKIVRQEAGIDSLSFEELMYGASRTPDLAEKEKIYTVATKKGAHWNAHCNLGAVYISMAIANPSSASAMLDKAAAQLAIAAKIKETPEVHANLASLSLWKGDLQKALDHANKSLQGANSTVSHGVNGVKGACEIHLGQYSDAIRSESSAEKTHLNLFNEGLAHLLSKDYAKASARFAESIKQNDDFAKAHYGAAIAAARSENEEGVISHLTRAVAIDSDLKGKALTDLEFAKWSSSTAFKDILK